MDQDGDEIMLSEAHQSQFTQSLLLFVCYLIVICFSRLKLLSIVADTIRETLYPSPDQILCIPCPIFIDGSHQRISRRAWCEVQAQY
jgi:hypothetical protein